MYNYDRVMQVTIRILRKFAHVIQVLTREQPIRLQDSHMTKIYIYMGRPLERSGLLNLYSLIVYVL